MSIRRSSSDPGEVTVVIATRDRRSTLLTTLGRLTALPEAPPIIVVDNASRDGTAEVVRAAYPTVDIVTLAVNAGVAARNVGVRRAGTRLIAFSDDDSWWAPGALSRAADHFAAHRRLGLLGARVLVGAEERLDPTSARMALGPWHQGSPGPTIVGFVACGAVVRREAFLAVGGFEARFGIGAEEGLLAMDLAAAGWSLVYAEDVVAAHHPVQEPRPLRRRRVVRNELWTSWLRRPMPVAARATLAALRPRLILGLLDAVHGIWWVARERRALPASVERDLRRAQER
ncbi:MAG TPA: glycosyltransferase [Baekduia sp.]|uniref:glycosyltransferase n=1 Tax=Baekduia sp. TaxID=2600305 RepID=UPI002CC34428|nr:glycosyltransferase [Baekduia sp.]HMJ35066.1 glycosyltransferase [Baekduia sp.]